ncbi:hypothetical protein WA588_000417, partial [Blastocystis sp. NMH]
MKGLTNFGNTSSLNSVLQLFLHLPPIRDFFLSDGHSKLNCFLQCGTTDNHISKCLFCILSELCAELYADNNDSFVQPVNAFHYLWKRYCKLRAKSLNSSRIPLLILQNELTSINEQSFPSESSFFASLFNSDSIISIPKPDGDCIDVASVLPKRTKSSLIILLVSESFWGTVVFPERDLQVPNEVHGVDSYDLYGVIYEMKEERYVTVIRSNGVCCLFQDEKVGIVQSFHIDDAYPRVLTYLRHTYVQSD